jgi:hypothetical protein
MNVKKAACITAATTTLGLAGGLTAAAAGSGTSTTAVSATFVTHPVAGSGHTTQCKGTDGAPYLHVRETDRGRINSDDRRIRGRMTVHIRRLVVNLQTGVGSAAGAVAIRNHAGALKASGWLVEALAGDALRGVVRMHLATGGALIANVSGHVDFASDTVTGSFGKDSSVADLSTITTGAC